MSLDATFRPLLTAILNHLDCAVILEDSNKTTLFANQLFFRLWNVTPEEVLGQKGFMIAERLQPLLGDSHLFNRLLSEAHERREPLTGIELRLTDNRIIEFDYAPVYGGDIFQGHLWRMRDITARKQAEAQTHKAQQLLELFFSQSLDGCFFMMLDQPVHWNELVDKDTVLDYVLHHQRLTRVNDAMAAQYGVTVEQLIDRTPAELFQGNMDYARSIWRQFFDAGRLRLDTMENRIDGTEIWIEGDYIVLYDELGRITGHFGIQRDITDRKQAEAVIFHQAYHDSLTGLPNRLLFQDRLNIALSQAERQNNRMALLFLDCYQFKHINDTFGHQCGDRLLQIVAERLTESVRKGDTVARLGGDEFIIILPRITNYEEIQSVAQRILTAFHQPVLFNGTPAELGASIGISVYPHDATTAEALLAAADTAMYQSKNLGCYAYCFYQQRPE